MKSSNVQRTQWSITLLIICFLIGASLQAKLNNKNTNNLKNLNMAYKICQNCYPSVIVKKIHNVDNIYSTGTEQSVVTAYNEGKGGFPIPLNHPILTVIAFC